jgi:predicted ATPase
MRRGKQDEARQVIVSTHSEEMLRDPSISAHEVLRLEPGVEGSVIQRTSHEDELLLSQGLTVADVLLPKTAPGNGQRIFDFSE